MWAQPSARGAWAMLTLPGGRGGWECCCVHPNPPCARRAAQPAAGSQGTRCCLWLCDFCGFLPPEEGGNANSRRWEGAGAPGCTAASGAAVGPPAAGTAQTWCLETTERHLKKENTPKAQKRREKPNRKGQFAPKPCAIVPRSLLQLPAPQPHTEPLSPNTTSFGFAASAQNCL